MKKTFRLIRAIPDYWTIHYLNDSESSWIRLIMLKEQNGLTLNEFEHLWQKKPDEKSRIKLYGREIVCPRYTKNYLKQYFFSGVNNEADCELPNDVNKLLEFSHQFNPLLNQALINWYEFDGSIGKHSDNETQLVENSDIFSFSFGPAKRFFYLESKLENGYNFKVELDHNTLVVMGGKCQSTHVHYVPKVACKDENDAINQRRINVTFRCFK